MNNDIDRTGATLRAFFLSAALALSGCGGAESAKRKEPVSLSPMETVVETLGDLKSAPPFRAEVSYLYIRETNSPAAAFSSAGENPITNLYIIELRSTEGSIRSFSGRNASSNELTVLKRLERGRAYSFPQVLNE